MIQFNVICKKRRVAPGHTIQLAKNYDKVKTEQGVEHVVNVDKNHLGAIAGTCAHFGAGPTAVCPFSCIFCLKLESGLY